MAITIVLTWGMALVNFSAEWLCVNKLALACQVYTACKTNSASGAFS